MKEHYTTDAINLKSYPLSESDKIILMYSKEKGLLRAVAKGAKKIKSKLGGRMESFVANRLLLNKGKNLDTICQAEAINPFTGLRNSIDKLLYCSYMAEVISVFGYEADINSEEIYDIFFKSLTKVSSSENKIDIMLTAIKFQLKIMEMFGYKLSLSSCSHCGCENNVDWFFSFKAGGIVCANCANNYNDIVKFQTKLKDFLSDLEENGFDNCSKYEILANEKVCDVCFKLLKAYINQRSEKEFKTTKMLEMV